MGFMYGNELIIRFLYNLNGPGACVSENRSRIIWGLIRTAHQSVADHQGLKYRAIPRGKLYFLDLGCSPGGFSSYILGKNRRSIGCGISLPVAEGGHEFCLEDRLRSRYTLFSANITYYALAPAAMNDARFFPLPAEVGSREFDLVLLDGHQLRTQVGRLPWDRDRLLVSQIIIALQSVKAGGTIIIKLPMPHKVISAKIVYMFRLISGIVQRGTFYLVAREVGGKEEAGLNQATFLRALRRLWTELTFGGENGEGRFLKAKDLDFMVTTDALIEEHVDWLVGFGKPLWEVQEEFLRGLLTKIEKRLLKPTRDTRVPASERIKAGPYGYFSVLAKESESFVQYVYGSSHTRILSYTPPHCPQWGTGGRVALGLGAAVDVLGSLPKAVEAPSKRAATIALIASIEVKLIDESV
ncbi:hypothetical protein CPC08DRAFT_725113 [Agrocybe pediades]|nr:hypothetical protein CPC08DRAFT_725113 [Agrocybe pediades]